MIDVIAAHLAGVAGGRIDIDIQASAPAMHSVYLQRRDRTEIMRS